MRIVLPAAEGDLGGNAVYDMPLARNDTDFERRYIEGAALADLVALQIEQARTAEAPPIRKPLRDSTLLFICAFALPPLYLLFGLEAVALLNSSEGLYAEVAREMLESREYIIPRLNGVPYVEMPPLLYYLLVFSMQSLGVSELAVRLVSVLAGALTLVVVASFALKNARPGAAVLAPLVLGTSFGLIVMAGVAMPDMLLCTLLAAALLSSYVALERGRKRYLYVAYALLALAVLTKGFVALVLFSLVLFVYALMEGASQWKGVARFAFLPSALLLFLAIVLPWHVAAAMQLPEFTWFYFVNEHVLRFFGMREPRDFHTGSILYHVPRLFALFFPWMLVLIALTLRRPRRDQPPQKVRRFLWLCTLVPLAFFSACAAKANYYMLVSLPFLALLTAFSMEEELATGKNERLAIAAFAIVATGMALIIMRDWAVRHGTQLTYLSLTDRSVGTTLWLLVLFGLSAMLLFIDRRFIAGIIVTALVCLPLKLFVTYHLAAIEDTVSARATASYLTTFHGNARVLVFEDYEALSVLPFYLGHPIGIIDSKSSDLNFGKRLGGPSELFLSSAELSALRQPAVVLARQARMQDLRETEFFERLSEQRRFGDLSIFKLDPAP